MNSRLTKMTAEDKKTLKRVKEAWRDIEEGRCSVSSADEFIENLRLWARS